MTTDVFMWILRKECVYMGEAPKGGPYPFHVQLQKIDCHTNFFKIKVFRMVLSPETQPYFSHWNPQYLDIRWQHPFLSWSTISCWNIMESFQELDSLMSVIPFRWRNYVVNKTSKFVILGRCSPWILLPSDLFSNPCLCLLIKSCLQYKSALTKRTLQ